MNVDTTKNLTCAFCTTDGGTTIAVENSRYDAESFNAELETEYRSRIGLETWGDNKVDNNVGDDTVNDTVKHPQPRPRTTTPYNTRTRSIQHPYKNRQWRLGKIMRGGVLKNGSLIGFLNEETCKTFVAAYNFVAPKHGMEGFKCDGMCGDNSMINELREACA